MTNQLETIENILAEILESYPDLFLVNLKIKPINNIKIYLDGDEGVTVEKCVKINRQLYKIIEEKALYVDGDFSLEVSSPGIDEPLKLHRQFKKNISRFLEITLKDETVKEGQLISVEDNSILIETTEGKGKKAVVSQHEILIENINKATVQIKW
jgi:ribosome maturation factor RimP